MQAGTLTERKPLQQLFERPGGEPLPLPMELARLYGELRLPEVRRSPYVLSNFVESLDGVAALGIPQTSGGQISGSNPHDRFVMGLLRAIADAVIVGAGTARSVPDHLWTSDYEVDASQRVFQGEVPFLVVTNEAGQRRLRQDEVIDPSLIRAIGERGDLSAGAILEALSREGRVDVVLLEGGPHLMGDFFAQGMVDELFLTLSPLVAGRDGHERPGIVAGREFAPEAPIWGELQSVRRADNHLFLRYSFASPKRQRQSLQKEV